MSIDSKDSDDQLGTALAQYLHSVERGEPLNEEEFIAAHTDLADDLRSFFRNRAAVGRMTAPLASEISRGATTIGLNEPVVGSLCVRYFGDYELVDELGRGGMGVVYRARQVSLNRSVALKMILAAQLATSSDVARFRVEAEAVANLDHPNIAPIYEIGEHEGQHYFSMKLIAGEGLRAALPRLRTDLRSGIALLARVARAVHHAHQRGVLHRDLKPANVLLGEEGEPYITDFGLAKRVESDSTLTGTGAILGTPSYMAPEQAGGEKNLSTAVDVYSLGAILYELLTGRPPFQADSPIATLLQVTTQTPVRPRAINPLIDRDLETICLKALEKSTAARYESAAALAEELDRWLRREPILARPVGKAERAWRWCRRNPVIAGLCAAMAGSLLLGTMFSTYFAVQAGRREADALLARDDAETQSRLAESEALRAGQQLNRAENLHYASHLSAALHDWESENVDRAWRFLDATRPEFRGWEYDLLVGQFTRNQRSRLSVEGKDASVAISPNRRWIAHYLGQGKYAIRDAVTLRTTATFVTPYFPPQMACIAINSAGTQLASSGHGDSPIVWDIASGKKLLELKQQHVGADSLSFSPDGRRIVRGKTGKVSVWDIAAGEIKYSTGEFDRPMHAVTFSPVGDTIASFGWKNEFDLLDAESGRAIAIFRGHTARVTACAFSPDGKRIASASDDSTLRFWDAASGQEQLAVAGLKGRQSTMQFSADGHSLAGVENNSLTIRDATTGKRKTTFRGQCDWAGKLFFKPDGKEVVVLGRFGDITTWDITGVRPDALGPSDGEVHGVAFSPDGTLVAGSDWGRTVKIWDVATGREIVSLKCADLVYDVAFSPDGKTLAYSHDFCLVQTYDIKSKSKVREFKHPNLIASLAFSPDGQQLAAGGQSGKVIVWNVADSRELFAGESDRYEVKLAYSPDGSRLAVTGTRPKIWDANLTREVVQLEGPMHIAGELAFSPDGKWFATGEDNTVRVWNAVNGRQHMALDGKLWGVFGVAFSPDSTRIACATEDGTVKLWDIKSGSQVISLNGNGGMLFCLEFSKDGKRLAAGGDGYIKIWDTTSEARQVRKAN